VRQQVSIGTPANHFPTPTVAAGLLLAPTADQVVAFSTGGSAAAGTAAPATSQAPASPASSPPAAAPGGGGFPVGAFAGIAVAGLLVLGGVGWLVWRRRGT
jgi:hypothetical protein